MVIFWHDNAVSSRKTYRPLQMVQFEVQYRNTIGYYANSGFSEQLLHWYDEAGRHNLPWQQAQDPYRVDFRNDAAANTGENVIPYFQRFIHRFSTVELLAEASEDELMHYWSGLGYYRRALYLHRSAKIICQDHHGKIPCTMESVLALPGIGRSTAGAILSLGFNRPFPILDGNVKRVLCRYYGIEGWPDAPQP